MKSRKLCFLLNPVPGAGNTLQDLCCHLEGDNNAITAEMEDGLYKENRKEKSRFQGKFYQAHVTMHHISGNKVKDFNFFNCYSL